MDKILKQALEARNTKLIDVDVEYTIKLDLGSDIFYITREGVNKKPNPNKIMPIDMLAYVLLDVENLGSGHFEAFIIQYIAKVMKQNKFEELQVEFDSSIFMTGCLGYCTYETKNKKVFFSPEILFKSTKGSEILKPLNAIEHELAHIQDFLEHPINYKKIDNEKGRKAEVSASKIFEPFSLLVAKNSPENAALIRQMAITRYRLSKEESFARMQALNRNWEFLKAIEEEGKRLDGVSPEERERKGKFIAEIRKYVEDRDNLELANYILGLDYDKKWGEIKEITKEIVSEYCDVKPENKYIRDEKTHHIFTGDMGQVVLALDTDELACQENFNNLFKYCMRDKYDQSSLALMCLIIGASHNKKSIEMIKSLFSQIPQRKYSEVLRVIKEISDELSAVRDYPFVEYKYFEAISQEMKILNKKNNQPTL